MQETFKIYVHRLKDGNTEKLFETLSPDFLGVKEPELSFNVPVTIKGEASLADDALVLRLHIETEATMACSICNQDVQVKIVISNLCHTEEVSTIKGAVFDYQEVVREAILLEVPFIAECNSGDCPERATVAKYFTKNKM
jgi:uncharacterized metal-binding protein YceD (DUF177 family)